MVIGGRLEIVWLGWPWPFWHFHWVTKAEMKMRLKRMRHGMNYGMGKRKLYKVGQ